MTTPASASASVSQARVIGVRAHDYGKQPVSDLLRVIAKDGWQTVQLAYPKAVEGVKRFADVTPEVIEATKIALAETDLSVAVLGAYVEPSIADEAERKTQAAILCDALSQARALHAGCVGTETTSMKKLIGVPRDEALTYLRQTLAAVLPEAERLGVDLAVEPVHHHVLNTPALTRALLTEMASPRLKIIFDPVNLLRPEDIDDQHALWARCMDCFGGQIVAVHIKGASREADNGILRDAAFTDSVVDYENLFAGLKSIDAPLLREKAVPTDAARDIAFLKGFQ